MNMLHTVISLSNMFLLIIILYYFYQTYRNVGSRFALGLTLFGSLLLLNALIALPMLYEALTPAHICPYEPFYTLAGGFQLLAILVLFKLVRN